jgi:hypothetical protein
VKLRWVEVKEPDHHELYGSIVLVERVTGDYYYGAEAVNSMTMKLQYSLNGEEWMDVEEA